MTRKAPILVLAFVLVVLLTPFAAGEPLTLSEARTLGLAQSKSLQEALSSVEAAKLEEKLQSYALLPSITASVAGTASLPSATTGSSLNASAGLSIKQTLFDGSYSILAAIDALSTSIARTTARGAYFTVLSSIDTAYYAAAKASASVDAAQSDLASAKASAAVAQAKREAGMLSPVDLMKQQATVASNEAALVAARGTLKVAMRTLASLTGLTPPITIVPVDAASSDSLMKRIAGLSDSEAAGFIANLETSAQTNNPSVQAANLGVEVAQKNVELASSGYLPSVSLALSGGAQVAGGLQGSASLSASLPLDFWNVSTTVASKKVAARQASFALAETQRTTSVAIGQAVYDTISSAKSVTASLEALDYARRYQESIQEQYKLSTASSADLSDAAQLVSTGRASLISAQYQFLSDLATLRTLAGVETDDLLAKSIP